MEHYKIVKTSYVGIDLHGDTSETSKFKCYHRESFLGFHWWESMKTAEMPYDNSTIVRDREATFIHLENAENFIHKYHELRHKVGKYTYEVIENINLK